MKARNNTTGETAVTSVKLADELINQLKNS